MGEIANIKESVFCFILRIEIANFKQEDEDNVTLILYLYMYEYALVVFRIIILIGVRILFLRSFLQGVWRCLILNEQQDKSHAFLLSNLKDNAELLGTWREAEK